MFSSRLSRVNPKSLLAVALLFGCDSGGTGTAAEEFPPDPRVHVIEELPVAAIASARKGACAGGSQDCYFFDESDATTPNFDCIDTPWPFDDTFKNYSTRIEDFITAEPAANVCIKVYTDNQVPTNDTCDKDTDTVSDNEGNFDFEGPSEGFVAFRSFPKETNSPSTTFVDTIEMGYRVTQLEDVAPATAVSLTAVNLIPTVLGYQRKKGTAQFGATLRDCDDELYYGGRILLYTVDGTLLGEGTAIKDPHTSYFDGANLPAKDQPWSHVDGVASVVNVPVSENDYLVEVWARRSEESEPEVVACESITFLPDAITVMAIQPRRTDSPSCPGIKPANW